MKTSLSPATSHFAWPLVTVLTLLALACGGAVSPTTSTTTVSGTVTTVAPTAPPSSSAATTSGQVTTTSFSPSTSTTAELPGERVERCREFRHDDLPGLCFGEAHDIYRILFRPSRAQLATAEHERLHRLMVAGDMEVRALGIRRETCHPVIPFAHHTQCRRAVVAQYRRASTQLRRQWQYGSNDLGRHRKWRRRGRLGRSGREG